MKKSKKHYVLRWIYENSIFTTAACGRHVATSSLVTHPKATYRKNHVTCGSCRATKVFRGVR